MVTAALVAGVGVTGVSAATAGAAPSHPDASPRTALNPERVSQHQSTTLPGAVSPQSATMRQRVQDKTARLLAAEQGPAPERTVPAGAGLAEASTSVRHKPRPKPVVTAATVAWVNPLPEASVTSCFGQRWGRLHAGVDLAAADGTRIRAAGAGTVVRAGAEAGYGNAVLIDHGNGYLTHYGHMSVVTVRVGQRVAVGEEIGHEGSTGHSTGPHLHFEVHEGTYKNPIEPTSWMHEHGVDIPGCADLTEKAAPEGR